MGGCIDELEMTEMFDVKFKEVQSSRNAPEVKVVI